jgi:hypothetical protein
MAAIRPATAGAMSPTGSIQFTEGTTILGVGTIVNGSVIVTTNRLSRGTHVVTAKYAGNANYLAGTAMLTLVVT